VRGGACAAVGDDASIFHKWRGFGAEWEYGFYRRCDEEKIGTFKSVLRVAKNFVCYPKLKRTV